MWTQEADVQICTTLNEQRAILTINQMNSNIYAIILVEAYLTDAMSVSWNVYILLLNHT